MSEIRNYPKSHDLIGEADVYHVVESSKMIGIWPIIPRGPEHGGLLNSFKGT